jgi:hypothetical protein
VAEKPSTHSGYPASQATLVRSACLTLATRVGDLLDDLVIVGGLVPSLLIPPGSTRGDHVGTLDLDVGLSVALLHHQRYHVLSERMRSEGFRPEPNERGNPARQTWALAGAGKVTVDFLIAPSLQGDRGGTLRDIEPDFAAFIIPGLHLAFQDRLWIGLEGPTLRGDFVRREVPVCGPGAFLVLKSLAFRMRGEAKDAYDLTWLLQNYGDPPVDAFVERLRPLMGDPKVQEALAYLREDFRRAEATGPGAVARFLGDAGNADLRQDAVGWVMQLLSRLEAR